MKLKKYIHLLMLAVIGLSLSCSKAELLSPEPLKLVQLNIIGTSEVDLEYLYKDSVIAESKIMNSNGINLSRIITINDQEGDLKIRKKGTSEILLTKAIAAAPFEQNINIYYDGNKIYNNTISLGIKGFALSGELEFLIDGVVFSSNSGAVDKVSTILIDKGTTREISIRKKGGTAVLLTKTIESTTARQNIVYFFDGTKIVDNVKLDPPVNPSNMMISARFETTFPNQFKGVDVDLVFYTRLLSSANTVVGTKITPEIRFTLPKDGSFNAIELPPLPGPEYIYSFDIYEKGTNIEPYNPGSPLTLTGYTIKPNEGRVTSAYVNYAEDRINFEAGKSKLMIITDSRTLAVVAGTRSVFISGGKVNDLSKYFQ
ncbi:hypothetical protein [Pedobacter sp. MC2016-24]|uniref:hypothetical protein n=1 Tax=Pedobacter sp. MC2016-24 TaxID=2780090 RepID=UPI00187F69CB|nr:hypothetical protein [Pedobacter sp. MC2016-24]MBE9602690.1 hypothetical protein [Pedobacter sp. MC2016-24]